MVKRLMCIRDAETFKRESMKYPNEPTLLVYGQAKMCPPREGIVVYDMISGERLHGSMLGAGEYYCDQCGKRIEIGERCAAMSGAPEGYMLDTSDQWWLEAIEPEETWTNQ